MRKKYKTIFTCLYEVLRYKVLRQALYV